MASWMSFLTSFVGFGEKSPLKVRFDRVLKRRLDEKSSRHAWHREEEGGQIARRSALAAV